LAQACFVSSFHVWDAKSIELVATIKTPLLLQQSAIQGFAIALDSSTLIWCDWKGDVKSDQFPK
jgi:hypothetical protein